MSKPTKPTKLKSKTKAKPSTKRGKPRKDKTRKPPPRREMLPRRVDVCGTRFRVERRRPPRSALPRGMPYARALTDMEGSTIWITPSSRDREHYLLAHEIAHATYELSGWANHFETWLFKHFAPRKGMELPRELWDLEETAVRTWANATTAAVLRYRKTSTRA